MNASAIRGPQLTHSRQKFLNRVGDSSVYRPVLNIFVSEIRLQRPSIVASVGESIAARMSKHVWMRLEAEFRLDPCPLDHPGEASRGEWCSAL